jgi:hypothetical protein
MKCVSSFNPKPSAMFISSDPTKESKYNNPSPSNTKFFQKTRPEHAALFAFSSMVWVNSSSSSTTMKSLPKRAVFNLVRIFLKRLILKIQIHF